MDEDQLNKAKVVEQDNPTLGKVEEHNNRTITRLRTEIARERCLLIEHELTRVLQQREYNTR